MNARRFALTRDPPHRSGAPHAFTHNDHRSPRVTGSTSCSDQRRVEIDNHTV